MYGQSTVRIDRVLERAPACKKDVPLSCVRKSVANEWIRCALSDFVTLLPQLNSETLVLLHREIFYHLNYETLGNFGSASWCDG